MYVQSVEIGWKNKLDEFTCAEENNMFCSNCGKKVEDGVKFCSDCGMPTDNSLKIQYYNTKQSVSNQTNSNDAKRIALIVFIALCSVVSAISIFFPILTAKVEYFFSYGRREFTFFELYEYIDGLESIGGNVAIFKGIYFLCIAISVVIGIAALRILYEAFSKGDEISVAATVASGFAVVRCIIYFIVTVIINQAVDADIVGSYSFLELTTWSWVTAGLSVVNMAVFVPLFSKYFDDEEDDESEETPSLTLSKLCPSCHTSFSIGEICPKCGTKVM